MLAFSSGHIIRMIAARWLGLPPGPGGSSTAAPPAWACSASSTRTGTSRSSASGTTSPSRGSESSGPWSRSVPAHGIDTEGSEVVVTVAKQIRRARSRVPPPRPSAEAPPWAPPSSTAASTSACSRGPRRASNCCSSTGRTTPARPAWSAIDPATNRTYHYWHVFVPGVRPGSSTATGSRGRRPRERGLRFDPAKVLLDPYGRGVVVPKDYDREAARRAGDNAATAMKSVVVDPAAYDWEGDVPLSRPSARTIIYEMHVRGFTRHPSSGVGEKTRGTYAGLIEKIPYLQDSASPRSSCCRCSQFDAQDCPPGLVNYWGYAAGLVLRAAPGVQLAPRPARPGGRVPRHGQGAAPGGHRGHPRRGVQPHRRGRSRRADALLPRARQPDLLHPRRGRRAVRQLHRLRQHAQRQPPGRPPDDRRQPALLGRGDARRRLPVRPRLDPGRATRPGSRCRTRRCSGTSSRTRRWRAPS